MWAGRRGPADDANRAATTPTFADGHLHKPRSGRWMRGLCLRTNDTVSPSARNVNRDESPSFQAARAGPAAWSDSDRALPGDSAAHCGASRIKRTSSSCVNRIDGPSPKFALLPAQSQALDETAQVPRARQGLAPNPTSSTRSVRRDAPGRSPPPDPSANPTPGP